MNLDQMKLDIEEREKLLENISMTNPLYHIIYHTLLERKEKYEIIRRNYVPQKEQKAEE